jgi:5-methylcytosine-specific restriction endonuclease McrA
MGDAKPWQDEERLRELYVEQDMSSREVAEELECSKTVILTWLDEFGIEKDTPKRDMTPAELEDEDALRRLCVERELTTREIASKIDCSQRTVTRWINEHGIEERPWFVGELRDEAQLYEMYVGKELGITEIADSLGCAQSTVLNWLRRHGIETRPVAPTGADSPHWTGGKSIYDGVKHALPLAWREQRRQQRERDNRTCQLCGEKRDPTEQRLDVNHLIPILCGGTNGDYNLMSMCRGCHSKTEAFVRKHISSVLVDWSDDELPEDRGRWTPDDASELDGQTELPTFADD